MDKISPNITLQEATRNSRGIKNDPCPADLKAMQHVANNLFEPIRQWYRKPIRINSFYRSPPLNKAVGGVPTSQHVRGEAIDIDAGIDNKLIWAWLMQSDLEYDQIIAEKPDHNGNPSWIHISLKSSGNRKEKLVYNGKSYSRI